MNKESSTQSTLVSLNIFATITTAIFAILSQTDEDFDFLKRWYIIAGVVLLYLVINRSRVVLFFEKVKSEIRFFLNIIVEYRRGHLEFLDPYGKKAMYNEESLFKKVKRGKVYEGFLTASGKISNEIHTYNCYSSLNPKKNNITIIYGRKKNSKERIINHRQLQFGFAVTFLDTFNQKEESWMTAFNHPTRFYDMKISFSKKNPPKNADIYRVTEGVDGLEKLEKISIDPLIINKYNRVILKIKLLDVKKGDKIKITWQWKQKKDKIKKEP